MNANIIDSLLNIYPQLVFYDLPDVKQKPYALTDLFCPICWHLFRLYEHLWIIKTLRAINCVYVFEDGALSSTTVH